MKNKTIEGVVLGCMACLMMACNSKKEEPAAASTVVDKEQIKTEIQAIENAFVEAYNNKQVDEITYYAEDAVSFLQGGSPLEGRLAILESLKDDSENTPKGNKFTFTTKEVFPSIDGNQVVEVGHYVLTDSTNTTINSGNYISLFEKRDGKYVCIRDIGSSEKSDTEK